MGFRILTNPLSALAGCLLAIVFALSLSWVSVFVGMKVRTSGAVQGIMFLIIMPLQLRVERVRAGGLAAQLDADVRRSGTR